MRDFVRWMRRFNETISDQEVQDLAERILALAEPSREEEARRRSDHSRPDLPRIKVVSPYSASWTHEQEGDDA